MIDAHVHVWDPSVLRYPWLDDQPALDRAFDFDDYARTSPMVDGVVFVEANCDPAQSLDEVAWVEQLTTAGRAPVRGIVAFADMTDHALPALLDRLGRTALVRGVRHNIQGRARGFCVEPAFVDGVREVGARDLTFDLCLTHDQLPDVVRLVRACPETRFILDHCGKPSVHNHTLEPWRRDLGLLAVESNVVACKISGLLTEARAGWTDADVLPFAQFAADLFAPSRLMYGSDWPVVTLAGDHTAWYEFTQRLTSGWTDAARAAFYHDNAVRIYRL